jgi:hypothetical protein
MKKKKKITAVLLGAGMLLRLMCPWFCENPVVYTVRAEEGAVLTECETADMPENELLPASKEVTPSEPEDENKLEDKETEFSREGAGGLPDRKAAPGTAGRAGGPANTEGQKLPGDATPSVPDIGAEPPRMLSLSGSGYSSLEKMSPAFSPDIHVYHFLDNRPYYHMDREMSAVVEPGVQVRVNGQEIDVGADGSCRLVIPYRAEDSANAVVLTNSLTGLSGTYIFHTYGYGVSDPLGRLRLVNAGGEEDPANIGSFAAQGNAPVYYGSTNLSRVRLKWSVGISANKEYRAEMTDDQGNLLDTILAVAGEEGESLEITSKVLNLSPGENTFYIKCIGKYTQYVNGRPTEKDGVHVTTVMICRNEAAQDEDFTDTTVDDLQIYVNDTGGKNYVANFDPSRRTYKLQLPYEEFNRALSKNYIYLRIGCKNTKKNLLVTGGSTLAGVSSSLRPQDNGCYRIGEYSVREMYAADSFNVYVTVTAPDNISRATYTIRIVKEGQAGLYVPDMYYEKVFGIGPSRPEREVLLTLGSVYFFDALGQRTSISMAKSRGHFHIEISDTSVIRYEDSVAYDFPIRLLRPGKVSVRLIYDDGKYHFEDAISVHTYYTTGYLKAELTAARELLEETQNSDRIYADGAKETFERTIASSQAVYDELVKVKTLTEEQRNRLTAASEALMAAEEKYRLSEIGKKITAFDPLPADIASQSVRNRATVEDVRRPDTVTATIDGKKVTIEGIVWKPKPVWERLPYEEVRYYFTAVLPPGYVTMEGVKYPQIFVLRMEEGVPTIVKKTIPLPNYILYQHLPVGSTKDQVNLPNLQMSAVEGTGVEYGLITVPVLWDDVDGFDGNTPGIYRFRSRLDPDYPDFQFQPNSTRDPMQTITVIIDPPVEDGPEGPWGGDGPGSSGDGGQGDPGDDGTGGLGDGSGGAAGDGRPGGSGLGDISGSDGSGRSPSDGGSPGGQPGGGDPGEGAEGSRDGGLSREGPWGHSETAASVSGASSEEGASAENAPRRRETAAPGTSVDEKSADNGPRPAKTQDHTPEAADGQAVKKKKWKVTQILGDTPESEGRGGLFARILILLLLLYGGAREYLDQNRKKRRDK